MKKLIMYLLICCGNSIHAMHTDDVRRNDVISVQNATNQFIEAWISGYRTTQPVVIAPGESKSLYSSYIGPNMMCTMAFETASITIHAHIVNQPETDQKVTVMRLYTDGCGFDRDTLKFFVHQTNTGGLFIDYEGASANRYYVMKR